ncbi:hypothetical protein R1flu_002987 [Riccia fluitans]|uniref:Lectin n=1 Tax=Riccia fluitans TaxID=41844 RepID=A0ABD1Y7P2_9MARC
MLSSCRTRLYSVNSGYQRMAIGKMFPVLLPLLVLSLSSTVMAVDIIFYTNTQACTGGGYSFNGASKQTCCIVSAKDGGSVLFRDMDSCKTSKVYKNGGCDCCEVGSGKGNRCYTGGGYTSGFWFSSCRRRSLLADLPPSVAQCQGKLEKPTGIVFTEDSKSGTWILNSPDAVELLSELQNLPHGEKVNWMKGKGAIFDTSTAL